MDETELALERLSDTSAFETLAVLYIERQWPEFRGLIQTGINKEGKPIPCPVDAIRLIPINDGTQRLVFLAATTTADEELSRKWLGEEPTTKSGKKRNREPRKGDIEKAAEELAGWKKTHPQARGILYLATNRYPDADLIKTASARANRLGLDHVEIIEASMLLRFLKIDADGQYIREAILKMPAARLGVELLAEICRESLGRHAACFPPTHAGNWTIDRDIKLDLVNLLACPGPNQVALEGPSGFGKSMLLRAVGENILRTGGFVLWVPDDVLETGRTPEEIVLTVLRQHRLGLGERSGAEALELAGVRLGGLVLLIDDINRLPRPDRALDKVREMAESGSYCRWVVPVWPGQLRENLLAGTKNRRKVWYTLAVGRYSSSERAQLAVRVPPELCSAVDGDPFLCALIPTDASFDLGLTRSEVLRQVIDGVIERATIDAAAERRIPGTALDFALALDALITFMLRLDEPEPTWGSVRTELGDSIADRLSVLGERSRLGRVEAGPEGSWRWTHDRLRDLIIGRYLARSIVFDSHELTDEENSLLRHPGLAEAWALAAAYLPPGERRQQALNRLSAVHPVALAKMLQFRLFPKESAERQILCRGLTAALKTKKAQPRTAIASAATLIVWTLMETDDPLVYSIIEEEINDPWSLLARFRNGDVNAGIQFIHSSSRMFLPGTRFRQFEAAVSAFGSLFDQRRDALIKAIRDAVGDDVSTARSVLILVGYLGWREWAPVVGEFWRRFTPAEKDWSLVEIIWAFARTNAIESPPEFGEAVLRACELAEAEVPSEAAMPDTMTTAACHRIGELTHVWSRWPVPDTTSKLFACLMMEHPDRAYSLNQMATGIDTPELVETVFRTVPRAFSLGDPFDPLSDRQSKKHFPRNPDTRMTLWALSRTESDVWARRRAFRLWRKAISSADLPLLREIFTSDPLFDDILAARLRLRDASAAPFLIERMNSDPVEWCAFAPAVYGEPGVEEAFESNFEAAFSGDDHRAPESVPLHLSREQICRLIERQGTVFKRYPRTWRALWRSDIPEALEFVRTAIEEASPDSVAHFFLGSGWPYPLSQRMLNAIRPVLHKFSQTDLSHGLGLLAIRAGFVRWIQENLVPLMQGEEIEKPPWLDRAKAFELLERAAAEASQGDMEKMERTVFQLGNERGDRLFESVIMVVREWFGTAPRSEQFLVGALIVEQVGTAGDWEWWQGLTIPSGQEGLWMEVNWDLRRRRWHSQGLIES